MLALSHDLPERSRRKQNKKMLLNKPLSKKNSLQNSSKKRLSNKWDSAVQYRTCDLRIADTSRLELPPEATQAACCVGRPPLVPEPHRTAQRGGGKARPGTKAPQTD